MFLFKATILEAVDSLDFAKSLWTRIICFFFRKFYKQKRWVSE